MIRLSTVLLFLMMLVFSSFKFSCQDPEEAFDDLFSGFYETSDGWVIQVEKTASGFAGEVTKAGTKRGTFQRLAVGDNVFSQGAYAGSPSSLTLGNVWDNSFSTPGYQGTATISGTTLTLAPKGQTSYTFTQSSTGTGGTPNPAAITLYNARVTGNNLEKKTIEFTVPTGAKKLTVLTTELTTADKNTADLFVRRGIEPDIKHVNNGSYTWTADCNHTSGNRGDKSCSFTNPASGKWFATVYGFNNNYFTQLIVTVEK